MASGEKGKGLEWSKGQKMDTDPGNSSLAL
jgi:hypothetical protein